MKKTAGRLHPLLLLGDILLLFSALGGCMLSFLSLYGNSGLPQYVLPSALPALWESRSISAMLVILFVMAVLAALLWSIPRHRFAALIPAVLLLAVLGLSFREGILPGGQITIETVSKLFQYQVGWFDTIRFNWILSADRQLAAVEQFFLFSGAVMALVLGWVVVCARRWWLLVLFTLPPLLPGLLSDIYPHWGCFLLLCACWCTALLSSLCRKAAPGPRGALTLAALPAAGLLLAAITLLFPMEGYSRPNWTYTLEDSLVSWGNRNLSFLADVDGPFTNRYAFVGSADTVNLDSAGPLNYTQRTALSVTSRGYTGRLYLRGASMAVYTGTSWEPLEDGVYDQYLAYLDEAGIDCQTSPLIHPSYTITQMEGKKYSVTVENVGASGSCAYAPYQLTDQNWETVGAQPAEDAYMARRRIQWSHTFTFSPVYAAKTGYADQDVYMAQEAYRKIVTPAYTGDFDILPQEVLEDFTQFTIAWSYLHLSSMAPYTDGNPFSNMPLSYAIQMVENYLQNRCVYDPDTPVTPEGKDFVAYFLLESGRGYCMHFASAATLLLRYMGFPARYVSGFTADVTAGRITLVPDSSAHAWVEVYTEGYGWYPVEFTPGYSLYQEADPEPESTGEITPSLPVTELPEGPEEQEPEPSEEPEPTPSASSAPSVPSTHQPQPPEGPGDGAEPLHTLTSALKWASLGAAAAALLWLGQFSLKKLRTKRLSASDPNRAALDGYRFLIHLKRWGGQVTEEATALAQKARFSQHTLSEEERKTMLRLFDAERQRVHTALSPVLRPIFRYFWGVPLPREEESP